MTLKEKLTLAIAHCGLSEENVAVALGMSRQSFHRKLKNSAFTVAELERISRVLGARFVCTYTFEDGREV